MRKPFRSTINAPLPSNKLSGGEQEDDPQSQSKGTAPTMRPLKKSRLFPFFRQDQIRSVASSDWSWFDGPAHIDFVTSAGDGLTKVLLSVNPGEGATLGLGKPNYEDGVTVTIHLPKELSSLGGSELFVSLDSPTEDK